MSDRPASVPSPRPRSLAAARPPAPPTELFLADVHATEEVVVHVLRGDRITAALEMKSANTIFTAIFLPIVSPIFLRYSCCNSFSFFLCCCLNICGRGLSQWPFPHARLGLCLPWPEGWASASGAPERAPQNAMTISGTPSGCARSDHSVEGAIYSGRRKRVDGHAEGWGKWHMLGARNGGGGLADAGS